jgi:hypothetical protein
VIDIDDPLASSSTDNIPQQHLAVFDRAPPEVVAVEVQQVKGEIGIRSDRRSAMASLNASCVTPRSSGHGDLAIQNHRRKPGLDQWPKRLPELWSAVMPVAAEQSELVPTGKDRDQPVAIMLDFMQPALALGRPLAGHHDLEADIAGHGPDRPQGSTNRHSEMNAHSPGKASPDADASSSSAGQIALSLHQPHA